MVVSRTSPTPGSTLYEAVTLLRTVPAEKLLGYGGSPLLQYQKRIQNLHQLQCLQQVSKQQLLHLQNLQQLINLIQVLNVFRQNLIFAHISFMHGLLYNYLMA